MTAPTNSEKNELLSNLRVKLDNLDAVLKKVKQNSENPSILDNFDMVKTIIKNSNNEKILLRYIMAQLKIQKKEYRLTL
ncbi:MAG: hypothetical protein LBS81_00895 [Endomicrobium sp.]|nr:hypothetical protein [Endomicrobium sp.]